MTRYRMGWAFHIEVKRGDLKQYLCDSMTDKQANGLIHLLILLEKLHIIEDFDFWATEL